MAPPRQTLRFGKRPARFAEAPNASNRTAGTNVFLSGSGGRIRLRAPEDSEAKRLPRFGNAGAGCWRPSIRHGFRKSGHGESREGARAQKTDRPKRQLLPAIREGSSVG